MARKKTKSVPKLTPAEEDLLARLQSGYQLESGPFGGPLLRNLKDDSVVRATSANQGTIRARERGLIQAKLKNSPPSGERRRRLNEFGVP